MDILPELLRSLENIARSELVSARDVYFSLVLWATFFTAAGVVIEGFDAIKELREERHKVKVGFPHADFAIRRHRFDWWKLVAFSGWLIVSIGVVGEFWFEAKIKHFDTVIKILEDDERQYAQDNEK